MRPPSDLELEASCRVVALKTPGEPQIVLQNNLNSAEFTFDDVFYTDVTQEQIFQARVRTMVDGALEGMNQTILAYGQTGSGKTYTMGTGYDVGLPKEQGMVPKAVEYLFHRMGALKAEAARSGATPPGFTVKISFLELYRDQFRDLFDRARGVNDASDVRIRDERGDDGTVQVVISNVEQIEVGSADELLEHLRRGSLARVTGKTAMNSASSRSHAIVTMYVTHRRELRRPEVGDAGGDAGDAGDADAPEGAAAAAAADDPEGAPSAPARATSSADDDAAAPVDIITTTSKFNFVDLAGSERLKRTHAEGDRAKEGININQGLFVLGNVISALGDPSKKSTFVPYRDSKLTRVLQDSLGGNSRTLMIACVSPVDRDQAESFNTLQYANRARNIKNKAVVNQDSASRQIQMYQDQIQKLTLELMAYRQGRRDITADSSEQDIAANELYTDLVYYKDENGKLKAQIAALKQEVATLKDAMDALVSKQVSLQLGGPINTLPDADGSPGVASEGQPETPAAPATPEEQLALALQDNLRLKSQLVAYQKLSASGGLAAAAAAAAATPGGGDYGDGVLGAPSRPGTARRPRSSLRLKHIQEQTDRARSVLSEAQVLDLAATQPGLDGVEEQDEEAEDEEHAKPAAGPAPANAAPNDAADDDDEEAAVAGDVSDSETPDDSLPAGQGDGAAGEEGGEGFMQGLVQTNRQLVETLQEQINIHDELLRELSLRDNELEKQRVLYEEKLLAAQQEKASLKAEMLGIKEKLKELKGQKGSEVKKQKKEYKQQLNRLQSRYNVKDEETRKEKRFEEEKRHIQMQKDKLIKSLEEVKRKQREAMEQAKKDLKDAKDREAARQKELSKLRKEHDKQTQEHRKVQEEVKVKTAQLAKTSKENRKLRAELDAMRVTTPSATRSGPSAAAAAAPTAGARASGTAPTTPSVPSRPSLVRRLSSTFKRKSSQQLLAITAKRKVQNVFNKEISSAVMYNLLADEFASLEQQRLELTSEIQEVRSQAYSVAPEDEQYQLLEEEIERLEGQIELIAADMDAKNGELLRLQKQGIHTGGDVDDLSSNSLSQIGSLELDEARQLLKEFLVLIIRSERECHKQRVQLKHLEKDLDNTTSVLKALAHDGMDLTKAPSSSYDLLSPLDGATETLGTRTRSYSAGPSSPPNASSLGASAAPADRPSSLRRRRSLSPKGRSAAPAEDSKLSSPRSSRRHHHQQSTQPPPPPGAQQSQGTRREPPPPLLGSVSPPGSSSSLSPIRPSIFPQTLRQSSNLFSRRKRSTKGTVQGVIVPEPPTTPRRTQHLTLTHTVQGLRSANYIFLYPRRKETRRS